MSGNKKAYRLLEKMGYKAGQGLGKNNEGIVEPITIQAHKGRSMLGLTSDKRDSRTSKKGIEYDSDDVVTSDEESPRLPQFVVEEDEKPEDEESPANVAKRLIASNQYLIDELIDQQKTEEAKHQLLKQSLSDFKKDLRFNEELVESYRGVLNSVSYLETITRAGKLDLLGFWGSLNSSLTPQTRCHMIQIFAVPLLKKNFHRLKVQNLPKRVSEEELEDKLFSDIIDVAREWLKTKFYYDKLIDWYIEWKNELKDYMTTDRVKYFRRKLLDVMFLATIKHDKNLNSFRYIPYDDYHSQGGKSEASRKRMKNDSQDTNYDNLTQSTLTLKELIEQTASERDILFRPVENLSHQSKQVYRLASNNIYIDNKVIFVKQNDKWLPMTLNEVMSHSVK